MPLHARFESLERPDYKIELPPVIERGREGHWENKLIGGFVVAICYKDDSGGEVYFITQKYYTRSRNLILRADPNTPPGIILPDHEYPLEFVNEYDEYGQLIIQHIRPEFETDSI